MRILFYYCCFEYPDKEIFIGTAHLYLKTFIDINYQDLAESIVWLPVEQHKISNAELIKKINDLQPDILCTSHYIWNHSYLIKQLPDIREKINPNIKIIVGGPNIDCHLDKNFFNKHSYADYAIYGAGEQAFADILNHLILGKKLTRLTSSNLSWRDSYGTQIVAPYKFQPELGVSPYVHNKNILKQSVLVQKDKGYKVALAYSMTRGCPYSCTYCDWNSGLGNKVSRRKASYEKDIDLFHDIGIKEFFLADANVGQSDDDVKMVEYFAQKNLNSGAQFHIRGNYSKLKKQNNLKIYKQLARANLILTSFNFSVQDVNDEILKNINRPDVGWETHKTMINELLTEFPHMHATIQLIQGLPGQTYETWKNTLSIVSKEKILPMIFVNETLPASPAMLDKDYQVNWNFEYTTCLRFDGLGFFESSFALSCRTFNKRDIVKMTVLSVFYTALSLVNLWFIKYNLNRLNIDSGFNKFSLLDITKELEDNLYQNLTKRNNFYFTMDFDRNVCNVSACGFMSAAKIWLENANFIKFIINEYCTEYSSKSKIGIVKIFKNEIHGSYLKDISMEHS